MKKILITTVAVLISAPIFAQDQKPQVPNAPMPRMEQGKDYKAFEKARKEQRAKFKATEEKMGKLVKEYNKLPDGKKKDAKRDEIAKEVASIHEEQLKFKGDQLVKFEQRLTGMKEDFVKKSSAEGKQEWVNKKTDELIANEGKLFNLFKPEGNMGPGPMMGRNGKGPMMGRHGKHFGRHGHFKGPRGPRPDFDKGPRYEKPVEMPKDK